MKPSNNISDSKGVSETSISNNIGPVPILKNPSTSILSCRFSLGKRAGHILSKERNPAMRLTIKMGIPS